MIKNEKGFNLVQVLVGLALSSVVIVGLMNVMSNSKKEQKSLEQRLDLDQFMDSISRKLSSKDACDLAFKNKDINQVVDIIMTKDQNNADIVFIEKGKTYLNDTIEIEDMRLLPLEMSVGNDQNKNASLVKFSVTLKHLKRQGYQTVKKEIILSTVNNGEKIQSCYYSLGKLNETDLDDLAGKICKGPGVSFNPINGKCFFKSFNQSLFDQVNQDTFHCDHGFAIKNIAYDFNNYTYTALCEPIIVPTDCKVKHINADGTLTCLNVSELIDPTEQSMTAGSECRLAYSNLNTQMKLDCGAGCTPSTVTPEKVRLGHCLTVTDSCGGNPQEIKGTCTLSPGQCMEVPNNPCQGPPSAKKCVHAFKGYAKCQGGPPMDAMVWSSFAVGMAVPVLPPLYRGSCTKSSDCYSNHGEINPFVGQPCLGAAPGDRALYEVYGTCSEH